MNASPATVDAVIAWLKRERHPPPMPTNPDSARFDLIVRLLQGMLANPALTATAPGGLSFLVREAIDLADRLLLELDQKPSSRNPSRGSSHIVQGEFSP